MDVDLESMTVVELKKELKSRSLKVNGRKTELISRLKAAIQTQTIDETTNDNDSTSISTQNQHSDFADFEEYINDEYNRLNNKDDNLSHTETVNIDDLLNKEDEDEEKHIILPTDNTPTPKQPTITPTQITSDFALNTHSKIEDRRNRFGTHTDPETAKVESRKRRFESTTNNATDPAPKKQRIDVTAERNKILQRAKKYGTALPKGFTLTEEESGVIYADKINRAKRFGTQHLLPVSIKKAEENAKKSERMKRFNEGTDGEKVEEIAVGGGAEGGATKLMERKLRFGTLTEGDKALQREERFGNKKNNNRQVRNKKKFQQFRAYKKNNRRGRGRGRGRGGRGRGGFGNGRGRGGFRNNFNKNGYYEKAEFNVEDNEKINKRKLRFNSM